MKTSMTKAQAKAFRRRWRAVNDAEKRELRKTSPAESLRQLSALMESVEQLGWTKALAKEEAEVRRRWMRLRRAYRD